MVPVPPIVEPKESVIVPVPITVLVPDEATDTFTISDEIATELVTVTCVAVVFNKVTPAWAVPRLKT